MLERSRDGVDEPFPDRQHGQRDEDDAGKEHRAEGGLPGVPHAEDDPVGEECVLPHARRQSDRVVREQAHEQGAEGGRDTGRDEDGTGVHARIGKDGRVDDHDVGHGHEGREPRLDLSADVGTGFCKAEAFEHGGILGGRATCAVERCARC